MASFSNEFLQRLKDSVNILDVIGSYVAHDHVQTKG